MNSTNVMGCNNVHKTSVYPIRCDEAEKAVVQVQHLLPCDLQDFPCWYLGLPLSLKRLNKEQLQPIINRIADQLPSWKADLLTKPGRKFLVQLVLTGMMIYLAMALDFPTSAYKAINKFRRGFFWRGRNEAEGGHCQVAWGVACRPMNLGGLGISSLKELGWSLRMRWLWLKKMEPNRPWSMLPTQVLEQVKALFSVAMQTEVGDGKNTMF
jgi:hypothetical protein